MYRVLLGVEGDAQVRQPLANFPAYRGGALADAAGKDHGVEAAEHRGQCADVLAELVAKELHRLGGVWLVLPLLQQRFHVGAEAGYTEQSRLVVHQVFELVRSITPLVHKMDEHPRVEIPAACAHHDAAGRRKAHAGIEWLTVVHRRQSWRRCLDVRNQTPLGRSAEGCHDVLVG